VILQSYDCGFVAIYEELLLLLLVCHCLLKNYRLNRGLLVLKTAMFLLGKEDLGDFSVMIVGVRF